MFIRPLSLEGLYVDWRELDGDTFRLYRSTSPVGPYEVVAATLTQPFYIDENVNMHHVALHYYYKAEGFAGGVMVDTATAESHQYNTPNPIANKVMYEAKVTLRVMGTPPVKLLMKRREGRVCPNCWNPKTKRVRFANCDICNGTGMLGGYHHPIAVRMSRDISQLTDGTNMTDGDKISATPINAWMMGRPIVLPGDVIVDVTNQRFSIDRVIPRPVAQYTIRQLLDMSPLEKGHPAYMTEVDWGDIDGESAII